MLSGHFQWAPVNSSGIPVCGVLRASPSSPTNSTFLPGQGFCRTFHLPLCDKDRIKAKRKKGNRRRKDNLNHSIGTKQTRQRLETKDLGHKRLNKRERGTRRRRRAVESRVVALQSTLNPIPGRREVEKCRQPGEPNEHHGNREMT